MSLIGLTGELCPAGSPMCLQFRVVQVSSEMCEKRNVGLDAVGVRSFCGVSQRLLYVFFCVRGNLVGFSLTLTPNPRSQAKTFLKNSIYVTLLFEDYLALSPRPQQPNSPPAICFSSPVFILSSNHFPGRGGYFKRHGDGGGLGLTVPSQLCLRSLDAIYLTLMPGLACHESNSN
ncbi:hypothetical protein RUM43_004193 [Polyplax serrata]|uniref:Uncharacterized protein n=1 Tax=Polyplax serrata TaxID=468196 RepID=A0AAN8SBH5_POLSC